MKSIWYVIVFVAMVLQTKAQKFELSGKLPLRDDYKKIALTYESKGYRMRDTADIVKGKFRFTGAVDEPTQARLAIVRNTEEKDKPNTRLNFKVFYLESGKTKLNSKASLYESVVQGGATQKEYNIYEGEIAEVQAELDKRQDLTTKYVETRDRVFLDAARLHLGEFKKKKIDYEENYIKQHPDSYITLNLVQERRGLYDPKIFGPYYDGLSERMKVTPSGLQMGKRLELAKKTGIGTQAIEVVQEGVDGTVISLSSLRGQYVLLDFWASWCAPCRAENPGLVSIYEQFKDRNFEILAVSLDKSREAWLKAIKDDGLQWLHVSELDGWKNSAAKAYGVSAVPQNILIDPNGLIVAKNLKGEKLRNKLISLLRE